MRAVLGGVYLPIGTSVTGKMITALRMLGFDKVFDTDFSADLTIMGKEQLLDFNHTGIIFL